MEYAYEIEVPVRYRDLDHMAHVNNAVYATYAEQSRLGYFREVVGADLEAADVALASLSFDFRRRVTLDDGAVTVATAVTDLGESSATMAHEVRADDEVAATGESVLVALDDAGRPAAIPDRWRERVTAHEPAL